LSLSCQDSSACTGLHRVCVGHRFTQGLRRAPGSELECAFAIGSLPFLVVGRARQSSTHIVLLRCVWLGGGKKRCFVTMFNILLCFRCGSCASISVFISSCHCTN